MNKDNKTSSSDEEQYDPVLKHFKELDKEKNQGESLSTENENKLSLFASLKQILIDTSNKYRFLSPYKIDGKYNSIIQNSNFNELDFDLYNELFIDYFMSKITKEIC